MKLKKFNPALVLGACLTFGLVGCSDDDDSSNAGSSNDTITERVVKNSELKTLEDAVLAADLAEALNSPDVSYTLFAPTDKAFENLLESQGLADLPALIAVLGLETVTDILLYHVYDGEVDKSAALGIAGGPVAGRLVPTLQGETIAVNSTGNKLYINDSKVKDANIKASNGIIHKIDKVLLPASSILVTEQAFKDFTIAGIVGAAAGGIPYFGGEPEFASLLAALSAADSGANAGLVDALSGDGPFTVFAPRDAAFNALLGDATLASFVEDNGAEALADILRQHVISGPAINSISAFANNGETVATIRPDTTLDVTIDDGMLKVGAKGQSTVIVANIVASNGIIHVIDTVITEPSE
jgi:uncharacterized surface protein with fasciclin (FAS1) repeats